MYVCMYVLKVGASKQDYVYYESKRYSIVVWLSLATQTKHIAYSYAGDRLITSADLSAW